MSNLVLHASVPFAIARWLSVAGCALSFVSAPVLAGSPGVHSRGYCPANGGPCENATLSGLAVASLDLRQAPQRGSTKLVASAEAEVLPEPTTPAERRRRVVFLNNVSETGTVVSSETGKLGISPLFTKLAACAGALSLLGFYFLLSPPIVSTRKAVAEPLRDPAADEAVLSPPPARVLSLVSEPVPAAPDAPGTWSELVLACGGDAARAGAVINGLVAADPALRSDSVEAVARALSVVKRA